MHVLVKIYFLSVFGEGLIHLNLEENAKVLDVLKSLDKEFGERFQEVTGKKLLESFGSYFNVFLNNEYLRLPLNYSKKLKENDHFLISRPISGG
jgi:hypothetical protein